MSVIFNIVIRNKIAYLTFISIVNFIVRSFFVNITILLFIETYFTKWTIKGFDMKMMIHMNTKFLLSNSTPRAKITVDQNIIMHT